MGGGGGVMGVGSGEGGGVLSGGVGWAVSKFYFFVKSTC